MGKNILKLSLVVFMTLFMASCSGGGAAEAPSAEEPATETPVVEEPEIVIDKVVLRQYEYPSGDSATDNLILEQCGGRGGTAIYTGDDKDGDKVLDSDEIVFADPEIVCNGNSGYDSLVVLAEHNATCQSVKVGKDLSKNNTLDNNEVTQTSYICNGTNGAAIESNVGTVTGTITTDNGEVSGIFVSLSDGSGSSITTTDGSFTLSNVTSGEKTLVINATNGDLKEQLIAVAADEALDLGVINLTTGRVLSTAVAKNSLISTTVLNIGDVNCSTGGYAVTTGLDTNANGILDDTEGSTQYVCNGTAGTNGSDGAAVLTLVNTVTLNAGDANCATGGYDIQSGVDDNGNSILDTAEIDEHSYVCNGTDGADGQDGSSSSLFNPIEYVETATLEGSLDLGAISRSLRALRAIVSDGSEKLMLVSDSVASTLEPDRNASNGLPTPFTSREVQLDGSGNYSAADLPSGTYSLVYITTEGKGVKYDSITVAPGTTVTKNIGGGGADIALNGSVTMVVSDGSPVVGANVRLNELDENDTTDSSGVVTFENLPAGTYSVTIASSSHVSIYKAFTVTAGNQTDLETIVLTTQKGTISGLVSVPGAVHSGNVLVYAKAQDGSLYSSITDETGFYQIPNVPVGTGYSVIASGHDVATEKADGVDVRSNETTAVATIALYESVGGANKYGAIEGYARYADVTSSFSHEGIIVSLEGTSLEAITARDGSFVINNIPAGTYTLNFTESRYKTVTQSSVVVVSAAATTLDTIDLVRNVGVITGNIEDSDGNPLTGVTLQIVTDSGVESLTTTANPFTFTGIPDGNHTLTAQKDNYGVASTSVTVESNATLDITGTPIQLQTKLLTGSIVDSSSAAIVGADILLIGSSKPSTTTDGSGGFEITGVDRGNYILQISKAGYVTKSKVLEIDSDNGYVAASVTLLREEGTLSGIVDLEGRSDNSGVTVAVAGTTYSTTTNSIGAWSMAIPANTYSNDIQYSHGDYVTETDSNDFTITASETLDRDTVAMSLNTGTISGNVSYGGANLSGARVAISSTYYSDSTTTDSSGNFAFTSTVPIGTYSIEISKDGYETYSENSISITNGSTATKNITIVPLTLYGTVKNSDGEVIPGLTVSITGKDSNTTDSSGNFELSGIGQGSYTLNINGLSSYQSKTVNIDVVNNDNYVIADSIIVDFTSIEADKRYLTFDVIRGQNIDEGNITKDLYLPTTLPHGTSASWSATSLISNSGVVSFPTSSTGDTVVTLTENTTGKFFTLTVPADYNPVLESVADLTVPEDFGYVLKTVSASNVNGETITYDFTVTDETLFESITENSATGEIGFRSKANANGSTAVMVTATCADKTDTDTFTVTVSAVADTPTAAASSSATKVLPSAAVTLYSAGSTDLDGDATYSWTIQSGPSSPVITNSTSSTASFTPDAVGTYVVRLTMTNSDSATSTSDVTIESLPSLTISDVSVNEGEDAIFRVSISPANSGTSFTYTTVSGTAEEYKDFDYKTGSYTFSGESYVDISVPVNIDLLPEAAEQFTLKITNITNGYQDTLEGTATIAYEPIELSELTGENGVKIENIGSTWSQAKDIGYTGDLNNDGFDDVAIGAPQSAGTRGQAYILKGARTIGTLGLVDATSEITTRINQNTEGDGARFGYSLRGGYNFFGWGKKSFVVSAPMHNSTYGRVYIAKTISMDTENDLSSQISGITLTNDSSSRYMGMATTFIKDVNGDGLDEVLVSSQSDTKAYVIFGNDTLADGTDIAIPSSISSYGFTINNYDPQGSSWATGENLADAGDMNGDGYGDFIVCKPDDKQCALIYGRSDISDIDLDSLGSDGVMIGSTNSGDTNLGYTVSGAGDINGDGYDDLLMSTLGYSYVYVIFGGSHLDGVSSIDVRSLGTKGFTIVSEASGISVSGAGDVNSDGIDDLVIGAVYADPNGSDSGKVYVVYGSETIGDATLQLSGLDGSNGFSMNGAAQDNKVGHTVTKLGDVNGDGYDDIGFTAENGGQTYIIYGGNYSGTATKEASQDATLIGDSDADILIAANGSAVLEGAGGADVLVGGYDEDILRVNDSSFVKVKGGNNIIQSGLTTGVDVLNFNFDGETIDLTVMAPKKIEDIEVFDIEGSRPNILKLDWKSVMTFGSDSTVVVKGSSFDFVTFDDGGWSMSRDQTYTFAGLTTYHKYTKNDATVYVDPRIPALAEIYITNDELEEDLGTAQLKVMRDSGLYKGVYNYTVVNGTATEGSDFVLADGQITFLKGELIKYLNITLSQDVVLEDDKAFTINFSGVENAMDDSVQVTLQDDTYLLDQLSTPSGKGTTVTNDISGITELGNSVASLGDINGDGIEDVAISSEDSNMETYIIFGNSAINSSTSLNLSSLDGTTGVQLTGSASSSGQYTNVTGIGDVNGDDYNDTMVCYGYSNGVCYILKGRSSASWSSTSGAIDLTTDADTITINGISTEKIKFATSLGDVNSDGIDDFAFGSSSEYALIIFGANGFSGFDFSTDLDGSKGFKFKFCGGDSVSGGDINGDGLGDIVVSEQYASSNSEGKVYVLFGSGSISTTVGVDGEISATTELAGNGIVINGGDYSTGSSVAANGDINGDGYDDIVIGEYAAYNATSNEQSGRVYVVYGSANPSDFDLSAINGTNGFVLEGVENYERIGDKVAVIGDINGDGKDEFSTGSFWWDDYRGTLYTIFGGSVTASSVNKNTMDPGQGFVLKGEDYGSRLGKGTAGVDINGDGLKDLVFGAYGNEGKAYIIYGQTHHQH